MRVQLVRIALAVVLTASASDLFAQTESRTWTMCSVDLYHACNSIMLTTTPDMEDGVRVGTFLTLGFQNLQGFAPLDNSDARTIWGFSILGNYIGGPTDASDPSTPSATFIGSGAGGGPPNGERDVMNFEVFAPGAYATLYDQDIFLGVQGCDPDPTWPDAAEGEVATSGRPPYFTCGPDSWISFSIFHPILPWIDASEMTNAMISGTGVDGAFSTECSGNSAQCKVTTSVATSVTPEPASIILVGTGLLLVAAGATRRRRKHGPVEA